MAYYVITFRAVLFLYWNQRYKMIRRYQSGIGALVFVSFQDFWMNTHIQFLMFEIWVLGTSLHSIILYLKLFLRQLCTRETMMQQLTQFLMIFKILIEIGMPTRSMTLTGIWFIYRHHFIMYGLKRKDAGIKFKSWIRGNNVESICFVSGIMQSLFLSLLHWIKRIMIYLPLGQLFPMISQIVILLLIYYFHNLREKLTLEIAFLNFLIHLILLLHKLQIQKDLNPDLKSRGRTGPINFLRQQPDTLLQRDIIQPRVLHLRGLWSRFWLASYACSSE